MIRPLIAGNWKMNAGGADGRALAEGVGAGAAEVASHCDLLVCPPAVALAAVAGVLAGTQVAIGGQDCHEASSGAHTGDLAAAMLAEAGASYVIVGHSERRADHGESDALVQAKAAAAHGVGLKAIICIGETEAQRDAGDTLGVLSGQIAGSIPEGATSANTVIAYEPVWAIGTGRTPTVDEVAAAHAHIRAQIAGKIAGADEVRLLYGGSVNPKNAADLLAVDNVNGALVGGASLEAASFLEIARQAPS
jgi:triosephosphate isomerase